MFWSQEQLGKFLYNGKILNSGSRWFELRHTKRLTVYAFPVLGGRIVDFQELRDDGSGRKPMYKVNVKLNFPHGR